MSRDKKLHPADAANAEMLARAVRFDIALFLGTGRYATASSSTLEGARSEAAPGEARQAGSTCRGGRCRWLEGHRDQSGFDES